MAEILKDLQPITLRNTLDIVAKHYVISTENKDFGSEQDLLSYILSVVLPADDIQSQLPFLDEIETAITKYMPHRSPEYEKQMQALAYLKGTREALERNAGVFQPRKLYKKQRQQR